MNAYKPLLAHNVLQSIRLLAGATATFRRFLVEGMEPILPHIAAQVARSLMLVTALTPVIGYDAAARVAHHAATHDLTPREACVALGLLDEATYDRLVDPNKLVAPYVAH